MPRRIGEHLQLRRIPSWDAFREQARKRLSAQPNFNAASGELSLENARFLVARQHGFKGWVELANQIES